MVSQKTVYRFKYGLITVVAMEVSIKHCMNSFPKSMNSFDGKLINFPFVYFMYICDWSIRSEVTCNWLSG